MLSESIGQTYTAEEMANAVAVHVTTEVSYNYIVIWQLQTTAVCRGYSFTLY